MKDVLMAAGLVAIGHLRTKSEGKCARLALSPTIEENIFINSAVGKPAILEESVSKYTARDCSLES
jgi:hypothetical protein